MSASKMKRRPVMAKTLASSRKAKNALGKLRAMLGGKALPPTRIKRV